MNYAPPAIMRSKKTLLDLCAGRFCVGIIDWFYLGRFPEAVGNILVKQLLLRRNYHLLKYSIWLVPIIPVVYFESKYFEKIRFPITGIFTWCFIVLGYYVGYFIYFYLANCHILRVLNVFAEKNESFRIDYWQMFRRIILNQLIEWFNYIY